MKFKIIATVKLEALEAGGVRSGLLLENLGIIYPDDPEILKAITSGEVVGRHLVLIAENGAFKKFVIE